MIQGISGQLLPLQMPQELALPSGPGAAASSTGEGAGGAAEGGPSFGSTMKQFLGDVNDLQLRSDGIFQAFVRGEVTDLHSVAIAQQEAGIALKLVVEMRDKLLGAYQEVMRISM